MPAFVSVIFYFFDAYSISFCDGRINWRFFFLLIDLSLQALLNILMNSADGEDGVRFILFLTLFIFGSWCVGFIFCVAVFFLLLFFSSYVYGSVYRVFILARACALFYFLCCCLCVCTLCVYWLLTCYLHVRFSKCILFFFF